MGYDKTINWDQSKKDPIKNIFKVSLEQIIIECKKEYGECLIK